MKADALGSNIPKKADAAAPVEPAADNVNMADLMAMFRELRNENAALKAKVEKAEASGVVSSPRDDDDLFPRQDAKPVERMKIKRVRIVLEDNPNIPRNGQWFGSNGVSYLLRPGMVANVPITIIDILNHAVEGKPIINPDTLQVIGYHQVLRYPYRRLPSERELAARQADFEEAA